MQNELTFTQLRDNLKDLLEIQGIPYIHNIRKELNAINQFALENVSATYVVELIGKLVEIKRHKQYDKDPFWVGCVINIADAYSYRVKIENLHAQLFPRTRKPIEHKVLSEEEVEKIKNDLAERKKLREQTPKIPDRHPLPIWNEFLQYCKSKLTPTRFEQFSDLKWEGDKNGITIYSEDEFIVKFTEKYFLEKFKIRVSAKILFREENSSRKTN